MLKNIGVKLLLINAVKANCFQIIKNSIVGFNLTTVIILRKLKVIDLLVNRFTQFRLVVLKFGLAYFIFNSYIC